MDMNIRVLADLTAYRSDMAEMKRVTKDAGDGVVNEFAKIRTQVTAFLAGLGVVELAKEFVQLGDEMQLLDARLRGVTGSARDFADAKAEVYRIAQSNNVALKEATELYTKLHDPVKRLGGTTKETGAIVEAFAMSLRLGGANSQEAAAATLQFAQAMASGRLQGDEFRSLAEASPRFMKAMAEGMGVPIEQLKKMGSESKLTADVVGNALLKSLSKLKSEAGDMPDTVGGAMTRVKNDITIAINELNKSSGLTLGIAGLIETTRSFIPVVKGELGAAFEAVGQFIKANREQLAEVAATAGMLIRDVWELAKAVAAAAAAMAALATETGTLKTVLEAARLLIAGFKDGVDIIGASFAHVGSQILQFLVEPMVRGGQLAAAIASVFDEDLGAKIKADVDAIRQFAEAGEQYAAGVAQKFADGGSAVARLGAEMQKAAKDGEQLKAALAGGTVSASDNAREMRNMAEKASSATTTFKKLKSSVTELTEEQKKGIEALKKANEGLVSRIQTMQQEANVGRELSEAEKAVLKVMEDVRDGTIKFIATKQKSVEAQKQELAARAEQVLSLDAEARANKELVKAMEEAYKERLKAGDAATKVAEQYEQQYEALRNENDALGLTKAQVAELELTRTREAVAVMRQVVAMEALLPYCNEETEAHKRTLAALQNLASERERGIAKQSAIDAADAWRETVGYIEDGVTDALVNGSHHALERIKVEFKRAVIHLGVQAVMNGVFGGGGGSLGGGGAGSAGSYLGAGMGAYSMFGGMSEAAIGTGLGQLYGTSSVSYMSAAELTAAGFGESAAGAAAGAEFGAGAAAGAEAGAGATAASSAAGEMIATFGPYALIALALYAALSDHSKWSMGSVSEGIMGLKGITGAQFSLPYTFGNNTEHERDSKYLSQVRDQLGAGLGGALQAFGADPTGLGLSISTDTDREGKAAAIISLLRDGKVFGGTQTGTGAFSGTAPGVDASKMDAGQLSQWFQQALPQVIVEALQQSDIEARFKTYFSSIAAADLTAEKASQMLAVATAVKQLTDSFTPLGGAFSQLSGLSVETFEALAKASGGFDTMAQSLSGYYANFYSETEKQVNAWDSITKVLNSVGIDTIPKTREEFRALVDSLNLSSDSGQEAFAALMKVQDAFAQLTPSAEDLAAASKKAAKEMAAVWDSRPEQPLMTQANISSAAAAELNWSTASINQRTYANKLKDPAFVATLPGNWQRDLAGGGWAAQLIPQTLAVMEEAQRQMSQLHDTELEARLSANRDSAGYSAQNDQQQQREQQQLAATRDLIKGLESLKESLTSYRQGLDFSSLSTLGVGSQYNEARQIAQSLYKQSMAGDAAAREQVQGAIDRFLNISKTYNGSNAAFAQDSDFAKKMIDSLTAKMDQFVKIASANLSVSAEGAKQTVNALTVNNKLFREMAEGAVVEAQRNVE